MDPNLHSVGDVLRETNQRLLAGESADPVWPTGFKVLDEAIGGGLRSGSLTILAGPQGLGKTTFALQVARNAAVLGYPVVYFCYEHEPETLLERLITLEAGEIADYDAPGVSEVRGALEARDGGVGELTDRLQHTVGGIPALHRIAEYSQHLHLHQSMGSRTDLETIEDAVDNLTMHHSAPPLVVVDYLQKVFVPNGQTKSEDDEVTVIVEGLKDLSMESRCPVLAIAAGDKGGIEPGRRMRAMHMRGSTALAYEPDVVLMMNNKAAIVARHHLVYDVSNMERYREWVVLSVEKNRLGRDGMDLEFRTRFDQSRFESEGRIVTEKLIDERVFTE